MLIEELAWVEPVDVISAEHEDIVGIFVFNDVHVLVDGISRAEKPSRATAHLRGNRSYITPEHRRQTPCSADMNIETVAFILGKDNYLPIAPVRKV